MKLLWAAEISVCGKCLMKIAVPNKKGCQKKDNKKQEKEASMIIFNALKFISILLENYKLLK